MHLLTLGHVLRPCSGLAKHAYRPSPDAIAQAISRTSNCHCRCAGTLHMATVQCKRAKARDKEADSGSTTPSQRGGVSANAPAAVVGLDLVQLSDQVLEYVQEREQKLWTLQLDVRDLKNQLEDKRTLDDTCQAQKLLVRMLQFCRFYLLAPSCEQLSLLLHPTWCKRSSRWLTECTIMSLQAIYSQWYSNAVNC
jgi:hypothetical protein